MKNNNKLSVTVGIPTCYGGESLVATVKSLRNSNEYGNAEIIIQADRTPIKPEVRKKLTDMGAEIYWNDKEGSQFKKLNQIIKRAKGDIFIFTQDDIIFDKSALSEIVNTFKENQMVTMIGTRVLPLPALTFFESAMTTMLHIVDKTGRAWNKGDNHLMASGRCLAFRTDFLRKYIMPETIVTGDAYLYLENRRLGGEFTYTPKGIVYIRCPQTIKDQLGPSFRYQYSEQELSKYFGDVKKEYEIPKNALIKAFLNVLTMNPVSTPFYVFVYIYTRVKKRSVAKVANTIWSVDSSTKAVNY